MTKRSCGGAFAAAIAVVVGGLTLGCGDSSSGRAATNTGGESGGAVGGAPGAGRSGTGGTGAEQGGSGGRAGFSGQAGASNASSGGSAGACAGSGCSVSGAAGEASATRACREYFAAVCARIRECGAPTFRPCESPIDACPDILFADDSTWTVGAVVACTAEWKVADCDALEHDQGPACADVRGARPLGAPCVFDAQCDQGHCNGGVVPAYQSSCGTCVARAPSHGACDEQHVCPSLESCKDGTCSDELPPNVDFCLNVTCAATEWCDRGACVPRLGAGASCTVRNECAAGLGCEIDIIPEPEPEPDTGTCQPLPPIGAPCLPTYNHVGACAAGGTCNLRPTGDCVELGKVGEYCGYTSCVEGAYCQVVGYTSIPSHLCYALGGEGDPCPHEGFDLGKTACMKGFDCVCSEPGCTTGACRKRRPEGEPCNDTDQLCESGNACQAGVCVDSETGSIPAGYPCTRGTAYGRERYSCEAGFECLCPDVACEAPLCATARDLGESCGQVLEICRQGLLCTNGKCVEVTERGIEAASCEIR